MTLYELATLRPAFTSSDRQILIREIVEVEPIPPRRVKREIPEDLETIILKAMAKEPEGRYGTAQELADDLRRFLENKPIVARRPSLALRTAKWVRRNSMAVTTAAATLAVCLSIGTVLLWQSCARTIAALADVQSEQRKTASALAQAEVNWQQAREAVDDMYSRVAEEWLDDQPHLTELQREFLEKAAAFYAQLPRQVAGNAKVRGQAAMAHGLAGSIELQLARSDRALRHLTESQRLYEELSREDPTNADYISGVAIAVHRLGHLYLEQGEWERASAEFEKALALSTRAAAGPDQSVRVYREPGKVRVSLGNLCRQLAQRPQAETHLREAVKLAREVAHRYPNELACQLDLINALARLSDAVLSLDDRESAVREAIGRAEKLLTLHPASTDARSLLADGYGILARVMYDAKQFDAMVQASRASIGTIERLAVDYPEIPSYRESVMGTRHNFALMLTSIGKLDDAEKETTQAVERARTFAAAWPNDLSVQYSWPGRCAPTLGNYGISTAQAMPKQACRRPLSNWILSPIRQSRMLSC